jgi:hypothetical protein
MTYNAAYFITKFEDIPEDRWGTMVYEKDGKCCAYGHCGRKFGESTEESQGLSALSREIQRRSPDAPGVVLVNDGYRKEYSQPTPKQRILAWLKDAQEAGL